MIQKLFCLLLLLFSFSASSIQAAESYRLQCIKELQPTLQTLRKVPEIEELVQRILAEGPFTIQYNDSLSKKFEGYWDPYNRSILITKRSSQTEADRIMTVLFEMHNATRSKDFQKLDHLAYMRQINKETYIRESEFIEYENCLSTSQLLEQGVEQGIFPSSCAWPIYDDFEDHYRLMKRTGHADWYASGYKSMG